MIERDSISEYYTILFDLKRYGDFSINEINKMIPYEIEIYQALSIRAIEMERNRLTNA